jgi:hypothetical protein
MGKKNLSACENLSIHIPLQVFKYFEVGSDPSMSTPSQYGKETVGSGEFRRFHGRSIPGRKFFGCFRCLPTKFLFFPVRNGRKSPDNSAIFHKFPGLSGRFLSFPEVGIIVVDLVPTSFLF